MSLKRGKLSTEDENFIISNVADMPIKDIAKALNRSEEPIKKFIKKKNLKVSSIVSDDEYHQNILLKKLRDRNYYVELQEMLTPGELKRFEEEWVEIFLQFSDNIVYTEETQVKQWIILQILADRSMKSRRRLIVDSEELQKRIDEEMALGEDNANMELVNNLKVQISYANDSMVAFTNEHAKLLDKIKDIERALKATREARVKRLEEAGTSWTTILKQLEDEDKRLSIGENIAIFNKAKDVAKEKLTQYHKYEDGNIDQPLLSPETVKDDDYAEES